MPYIFEIAPIFIQRFYSGWITLRNQLATPVRVMGRRVVELYDALLAGNDWEVTPKLSLKRRAGHTEYVTITYPAMFLYSWKSNTQGTIPIIDTTDDVEYISSDVVATQISTKTTGAGLNTQSSIMGIGNYLYVGNPQVNFKWDGPSGSQGKTNWGISASGVANSFGPDTAGAGDNIDNGATAWTDPSNVTSAVNYATAVLGAFRYSQYLAATTFSFSIPATEVITGVLVTYDAMTTASLLTMYVQLTMNGSVIGAAPSFPPSTSSTTYNVGGDLWGLSSLTPSQINGSTFGVTFKAQCTPTSGATVSIRNVKITILGTGGPTATPTGSGSFTAVNGYSYVLAYANTASGEISNATQISANTGAFASKSYVGVTAPPSSDTQVNQIKVYRTTDSGGGALFFEISNSPFPNVGYTLTSVANASGGSTVYTGTVTGSYASAVGQNFIVAGFTNSANNGTFPCTASTSTTITLTNASGVAETHAGTCYLLAEDTTADTLLSITSQAEINLGNTPPPAGLTNLEWFAGRMWGSVNNLLYASTGPQTISGTAPNSNWNPTFQWLIPQPIIRNVRGPNGMCVFTVDDCYIVRGTDIGNYTVNEFVKNFGVRTYNAIDTDGTNMYVFTSDRQFIMLSPTGADDIGLAIADQLQNVDPTSVYVSVNRYGLDSIVRILDTVNNVFYDYNLNQQCWHLPGILQMPSCTAMGSIETSPGVWRLLLSTDNGTVTLAYRDITTFTDLGTCYAPVAVFGSLQVADPGTLAKFGALGGIRLHYTTAGNIPELSVLPNDIGCDLTQSVGSQVTGTFISLSKTPPLTSPPTIGAQPTGFRNLTYYWSRGKAIADFLEHFQVKIAATAENAATELLGFGIFPDQKGEAGSAGQLPPLQGK